MTTGISGAAAGAILDDFCTGLFAKLHTGDPGAAGAANAFGDTTRKAASFAAAGTDGVAETNADIDWTNVTAAGTVSHLSFWDASSGGNFKGSDVLGTARTLAVGDNFTVLAGDGQISIAPIAA